MPEQSIRFVVSNDQKQRAATWKCWTPSSSNDVYVVCREIGSAVKASLHESHQWHLAYIEHFYERSMPDEQKTENGRFIQKWPRPPEIAPGFTLALRIYTPFAAVNSPLDNPDKFVCIPAPPIGLAIETSVFLQSGEAAKCECPGRTTMGTQPVGAMTLQNGDTVSVVYRECQMPDVSAGPAKAHLFSGVEKEELEEKSLRMLLLAENADGSRSLFDFVGEYDEAST